MPLTYWLELIRRALIGSVAEAFPTLAGYSNGQLLAILAGLTVVFGLLSFLTFRRCDYLARERGLIDITTHY
jgi:ABC-2 type transport system permease protein